MKSSPWQVPAPQFASLAQLQGLASGLCMDAGIRVEAIAGPQWSYNHVTLTIQVPQRDIDGKGVLYCAGVLAHEVGHFFISRYHKILHGIPFPSEKILNHLLNGLEDPRVNQWIKARYPGSRAWFEVLVDDFASLGAPGVPEVVTFGVECHADEMRNWIPRPKGCLPKRIALALASTGAARRRMAGMLPSLVPGSVYLDERLASDAERLLAKRLGAGLPARLDARELDVLSRQAEALDLIRTEVIAHALDLLNTDCARLGWQLLARGKQADLAAAGAGRGSSALRKRLIAEVSPAMIAVPDPPTTWRPDRLQMKGLVRILEWFMDAANPVQRAPMSTCSSAKMSSLGPDTGPASISVSLPEVFTPQPQGVEHLSRMVQEGLNPHRLRRFQGGFATGSQISMPEAKRLEAEPERYRRLWRRRIRPTRPDAAFGLLVDLSGSMRGKKIQAALLGTMLVAETLERLEIPYMIHGFQDQLIPFVDWNESLTPAVRQRISSMQLEVSNSRPGGNNKMRYNDDGPCLARFASHLRQHAARDRFLVVVSDGGPAGLHSNDGDLHRAVLEITTLGELQLIGLGLGAGTEHVSTFYPRSIACVPEAEFPARIGQLILQSCGVPVPGAGKELGA